MTMVVCVRIRLKYVHKTSIVSLIKPVKVPTQANFVAGRKRLCRTYWDYFQNQDVPKMECHKEQTFPHHSLIYFFTTILLLQQMAFAWAPMLIT